MIATQPNPWKIGLFVVAGLSTAIGSVFWIGVERLTREKEMYVTFFDESVQGLEVGAPVKMRGVTIGTVKNIGLAVDRRLVRVEAWLYTDIMMRLGLGPELGELPLDLRVQLSSTGITGVKFLLVDFFLDSSLIELDFPTPPNYVPSAPSTLKSLEDGILMIEEELPGAIRALARLTETMTRKLEEIDVPELTGRLQTLMADTDELVERLDSKLADLDVRDLSEESEALLESLQRTSGKVEHMLDQLDAGQGPLGQALTGFTSLTARTEELVDSSQAALQEADLPATTGSMRRTFDAYGGVANEAAGTVVEAQRTLVLLRETLASLQALAGYLERQPGALLRGRAPELPLPAHEDR